jgi:spore coat protein F
MKIPLEDKEILNVVLSQHKLYATSIANLILESGNQTLRNDAVSVLQNTFKHQKKVFDFMSQKGWYPTDTASPQDISRAREEVTSGNRVPYSY